jgi:cellulose synthase/poly-beta-1,6-N-acetylglucosamine synthase-like glycosyltransferase
MNAGGITVAVATCGKPADLERCLAALATQTAAPDAVLVVDQDPSPAARAVAESSGLPGLRYLEQERLGLSASRNLALRETATDRLAVTDDDCVPDPGWIAGLAAGLAREPTPGAVTGRILPFGERPPGGHAVSLRESSEAVDHSGRIVPWGVGSGANFAAPVALLRGQGGWNERLGVGSRGRAAEDADLIYRLLITGVTIRYAPDAIVRHAWQTAERRMASRWTYGFGVGAMCGMWLARRDRFALAMLNAYARHHARLLLTGVRARDRFLVTGHTRALVSILPGMAYGLRNAGPPALPPPVGGAS